MVVEFLGRADGIEHPLADARLVLLKPAAVMVGSDQEMMRVLRRPPRAYLAFVVDVRGAIVELKEAVPCLPGA